jgi:RHS repeat-associated protein
MMPGRLLGFVALGLALQLVAKADGLVTNRISVPSGPGSIEGLGDSFEPQLNTGTYVFTIPIKGTRLRGSVQPEISLTYNSGGGSGIAGMGWRLNTSYIQRQTDKGLPSYTAVDTIVDSTGEELVKLADGTFRAENESGFVKWEDLGASGWRATAKNGTVLRFGQTAQARQNHPTLGTFRWMLESAEDVNGNRVGYAYFTDASQIYLSQIEWGLHSTQTSQTLRLVINYTTGRPDPVVDYRGRFRCETKKRLSDLTLIHDTRRLRYWKVDYWPGLFVSLLKSVTAYGDDRSMIDSAAQVNRDFLPPIEFDYSRQQFGVNRQMVTVEPVTNVNLASGAADLVDLNRDGLPDILYSESDTPDEPAQYFSMVNRGPGRPFGNATIFTSNVYLPDLRKPGVRIADWKGDSRNKVLIPDGTNLSYRDFTSETTVGADVDYPSLGFNLTDPQVQVLDVNNDRALDLVAPERLGAQSRFAMLLSSRSGPTTQFVEGTATPVAASVDFTQGWQWADMNGDRILDVVAIGTTQEGGTVYYPHKGFCEYDPSITITGGPADSDLGPRGKAGLTLVDIDMDGLADLVMVASGVVKIWPNRAGTAWDTPIVMTDASIPGLNGPNGQDAGTAVRFADMNGNGSVDIVWNDPGAGYFMKYLELHPNTKPNQLTHMSNGMGKTLEIEYKSSVDFMLADDAVAHAWTVKPPFPISVVSAYIERDGMGSTYRTEIAYRNGYYDAMEREFRGFESATRTDVGNVAQGAPSLLTEFTFHTGSDIEALKGRPRQVERREVGGAVFDRVTNAWQTRQLPLTLSAGELRAVTFCFQGNASTEVLEKGAGAPVTLYREFTYDDYGNQTRLADYGQIAGANLAFGEDERVITRTFTSAFASGQQLRILDLPVDETIADGSGTAKARTEYYYDDETFGGGNRGSVVRGNLTLVRKAVDVAAGTSIQAERLNYDAFGNVTHSYDPLAGAAPGHSRIFSYDPDFHTYVESETIDLGNTSAVPSLTATAAYDKGLGVMTSSTDFNGNVTEYRHDTFARLASITKPGDALAAPTELYNYRLGMDVGGGRTLNWISASKRETAGGGTLDARMFFDGLGRKVMTRSEGENPAQTVVTDTVVFNDRRGVWKQYLPYFDTGGLDWKDPTFEAAFVENTYDATERAIGALNPPETAGGVRKATRTEYRPLQTVLYDEEDNDPTSPHTGTPNVQYKDGLNRLIGVDERSAGETWPTRYTYDVLDNLTRITDSQGNVKTMAYDGLKRMTGMNDPDRGLMSYTFDAASNLIESVDAKGQHIVMTYDGANRIKTEDYLDAAGHSPDVLYSYDGSVSVPAGDGTSATSANPLGKLVSVTDLSGAEVLSCDNRGRTAWKIKRVPDPANGAPVSYQSAYQYDALDRVTQLTYPDGDRIGYGYNSRGLPANITGGPSGFIISDLTHIATGQLASCQYGNGFVTSYQYDPRQRLRALNTDHSTLNTQLISFSYTFDGTSNVTRIDDNRPTAAIPSNDPRRNTQVFAYDDLYRLTEVQYPATSGQIAYGYDRLGNMLSQTSNIAHDENGLSVTNLGMMSYGGTAGASGRQGRDAGQPGPHALTAANVGGRSYPYDANGNMQSIDGLACTWDFKDRLTAVENAQMRAEYTYDYTDRRITKRVFPKTNGVASTKPDVTLYVDRTFEQREDGAPVKYIWNGDTRVARVTANLNATQRVQRFTLQPGWNLVALAVTLTDGPAQLLTAPVQQVYRQGPGLGQYSAILPNEAIPAGTILRVQASAAGTLALRGIWAAPAAATYPAGRQWIANSCFEPLDVATRLPADAPLWFFDAATQDWRHRFLAPLASACNHPPRLAPGEVTFATTTAPFTLSAPDPTLEIRYYHQDHLGSSSVMSDANGQPVSETAFYPFGHPRQEFQPRGVKESYSFTQKERDDESGLDYFEARFLITAISRFCRVDPACAAVPGSWLHAPQRLNFYSYALNSPLVFRDPTGLEGEPADDLMEFGLPIGAGVIGLAGQIGDSIKSGDGAYGTTTRVFGVMGVDQNTGLGFGMGVSLSASDDNLWNVRAGGAPFEFGLGSSVSFLTTGSAVSASGMYNGGISGAIDYPSLHGVALFSSLSMTTSVYGVPFAGIQASFAAEGGGQLPHGGKQLELMFNGKASLNYQYMGPIPNLSMPNGIGFGVGLGRIDFTGSYTSKGGINTLDIRRSGWNQISIGVGQGGSVGASFFQQF